MTDREAYATASAVEAAIRGAAQTAHREDPSVGVSERIRQAYFDRFLSRVFSEGDESEWMLKGGTGMLARVSSARTTTDIDLFRTGFPLNEVLVDLRRLASIDLGDHFRFVYRDHSTTLEGTEQPYADGYRVRFDAYLGVTQHDTVNVDLALGANVTGVIETLPPRYRLHLGRLKAHDYRLYPLVDQVADKVCATMATYSGRPSSRVKDLVDLVIIANTQEIEANALQTAIDSERSRRRMAAFARFVIPANWGATYERTARTIPACAGTRRFDDARELMSRFLDPAISGEVAGTWANGVWNV